MPKKLKIVQIASEVAPFDRILPAIEGAIGFPEGAKLFMNIRPTAIHDPSFQPDALTRAAWLNRYRAI